MRNKNPKRLGDILEGILKDEGIYDEFSIKNNWQCIVGDQIGKVTCPDYIDNKILIIRVKNSMWKKELKSFNNEIINKINHSVKKELIIGIKFKIGLRRRLV
jgi:predicted nucleic acid-binding Zn ribbon protein